MLRVRQNREANDGRRSFLEHLHAFDRKIERQERHAGRVSAWSAETRDDAGIDRITAEPEHDRDRLGGERGRSRRRPPSHDKIDALSQEFEHQWLEFAVVEARVAGFYRIVVPLRVAERGHALAKAVDVGVWRGIGRKIPDPGYAGALRLRQEGRAERGADSRNH